MVVSSKTDRGYEARARQLAIEKGWPADMVEQLIKDLALGEDDELITLSEAESRYRDSGLNRLRLNNWVQRERLKIQGRIPGPGPNGVILVSDKDIRYLIANPPATGGAGHRTKDETAA